MVGSTQSRGFCLEPPASMAGEILRVSKEGSEEELEEEEDESMTGKGKDGIILSSLTATDGTSVTKGSSVSSTFESGFEWVEQLCGLTPSSRQGQLVYMGGSQNKKYKSVPGTGQLGCPLLPLFSGKSEIRRV